MSSTMIRTIIVSVPMPMPKHAVPQPGRGCTARRVTDDLVNPAVKTVTMKTNGPGHTKVAGKPTNGAVFRGGADSLASGVGIGGGGGGGSSITAC